MSDGSPKVPAQASPPASATASYARMYEEQQPRLVAYARSLTRNNSWAAEDLVAEAHFRVWRRLSAGHEIENVPAYLMTTVRHLAATAGGEARETPHDPRTAERTEIAVHAEDSADPAEQVSEVDLLVRVLGQLPERWVQALWLAEAEGQPLETVGQRIGAKQGATAVLLHRAREGMRQAFLRSQTGAPDDPACEVHWVRMPAYVRGNATPRQSERLLAHVDACDDCRGRLAVLMRANDRLPALVGPALLVFVVGGAGKLLLPFVAGSAGASAATAALSGQFGSALHAARQAVTGGAGGAKVPTAIAAGATVAGAALAMMLALGTGNPSPTPPPDRVPLADAPVAARPSEGPVAGAEAPREPGGPGGPGGAGGSARASEVAAGVAGGAGSDTAVRGVVAEAEPGAVPEPAPEVPGADAPAPMPPVDVPAPPPAGPVIKPPADPAPPQNDTPPHNEPAPGSEYPVAPAPADPAPTDPEPAGPEPVAPEPVAPEPVAPEPVAPEPVAPEPVAPEPVAPEPVAPAPADPGEEQPETPGQGTPPYPDDPEAPGTEAPATPTPSPTPEPSTPTPVVPTPIDETPEAPEAPAPPETTGPAPVPAPAPQPTPEPPGNGCGN
ncbi:sigma-70 family RNA polymerase sigma factor [Streptomyces sp. R28]|uniref:Sigma-70 family RNA polymerase sigma factor n=1 Tax=Streptomyces sp. R28 TaxID=3238628 RepID=A0AB39PVL7_9ACTN